MARTHTAPLKTARWAALRNHVAHRAGFRCEHCNEFLGMTGQADHVVPRSICEDVGIGVYDPVNGGVPNLQRSGANRVGQPSPGAINS